MLNRDYALQINSSDFISSPISSVSVFNLSNSDKLQLFNNRFESIDAYSTLVQYYNASANMYLDGNMYENNGDTNTNKALVKIYPQSMDLCSKLEYGTNDFRVVSDGNTFINNNIRSFMEIECLNVMFDGMNVSNNNFSVLYPFLINSEWMKVSVDQSTFAQNKRVPFHYHKQYNI